MKNIYFKTTRDHKNGQSFVELSLILLILALMLSGVVEFGYLLNSYLKVQDGTREGARYSNMGLAFEYIQDINTGNYSYVSRQDFYINTAIQTMRVMSPIVLNGNRGDDIVISVFSVAGSSVVRWPEGLLTGWSLCHNYSDPAFINDLSSINWNSCERHNSNFTSDRIRSIMNAGAPASGVLLVEVFYNYPQILKLPVFVEVIPDPIPVYAYSVMPLSSAEPTSTPGP
jgi:hypothetical protein